MEQELELETLKKQLENVKQEKNHRLLSYDPFSFGFLFGLGLVLAFAIAVTAGTLLSLALGVGLLSALVP